MHALCVVRATLQRGRTCVEKLAGEILVKVQAFLFLGAAVHQVELAQLHFARGESGVRVRTVAAS